MKQFFLLIIVFVNVVFSAQSQHRSQFQAHVELGGLVSSADRTPFWLRANQFGIVPNSGSFGTLRAGFKGGILLTDTSGRYARKSPSRAWTLSYGAEAVGNMGSTNELLLPEAYVKLSHRQIEFVAGRRREVIGLVDTTLSSGSYSWSGNALPIPKIQFGTKGFAPIGRRKWLAINAFIAHGWFANTAFMQHSFLHQKSIIFRVGKPNATFRFYAGVNHNVQWAGRSDSLDYHYAVNGQLPNKLSDFPNVLFAIRMDGLNNSRVTSFDYVNLYGNHLGNFDLGLEVRLLTLSLLLYHQHSFEDLSGILWKNIPDGLSGLRIRPVSHGGALFQVNDLLIEFLTTLQQSGPSFDPNISQTETGADNYFNNQQYRDGWTYKGRIIGTPFITLKKDVQPQYQTNSGWVVNNNRVQMLHVGMRATIAQHINLIAKVSYSKNYGVPMESFATPPTQLSSFVQIGVPLNWLGGVLLTASAAGDFGALYANSIGGYVGLRKVVGK